MTDQTQPPAFGTAGWMDLTVPNADEVRAFYERVLGWKSHPLDMGGYSDFVMMPPSTPPGGDKPVGGVCHARGSNADLPPVWMVYFLVEDIDASLREVGALGGQTLTPVKSMGPSRYCVIRDPGGAVCALYQP